jgi:chromosome segregation protein
MEMLSSVNIGSSGHHIISQGEADRILNSSSKERRGMIEDALGLRLFQYRIRESERKLEKTEENMKEVSLLRKEIAPHLNFLKKQVEKLEKAASMRIELGGYYREYLRKEESYINTEKNKLSIEKQGLETNLKEAEKALNGPQTKVKTEKSPRYDEINKIEKELGNLRNVKDELSRKLGRLEGMIEMSQGKATAGLKKSTDSLYFSTSEIQTFVDDLEEFFASAEEEENVLV